MLEPREANVLVLLFLLVVLPLVTYILLGKWSDAAKRNERVAWLAQQAASDALRAETMTFTNFTSGPKKSGVYQCARCLALATTRCSRCKSTRYCSGRCQIIHWRQIHMYECQNLEITSFMSSPAPSLGGESTPECFLPSEETNFVSSAKQSSITERVMSGVNDYLFTSDSTNVAVKSSESQFMEVESSDKTHPQKVHKNIARTEDGTSSEVNSRVSRSPIPKSGRIDVSMEIYPMQKNQNGPAVFINGHDSSRNLVGEAQTQIQCGTVDEPKSNGTNSRITRGTTICDTKTNTLLNSGKEFVSKDATSTKKSIDKTSMKSSFKTRSAFKSSSAGDMLKSTKPMWKESGEQTCSGTDKLRDKQEKSKGSYGAANMGFMKITGQKKSANFLLLDSLQIITDKQKNVDMLFPYEEFVKLFQFEGLNLSPRGLLNCGNSCYANAVLQCLTYTKPLIVYLLGRLHSRSCCAMNWCLMCELEQHAMMSRESGPPLSPSMILSHIRSNNCQIGDGSQEDAHEFLRFLVTSMQSICLEGLGGEKKVNSKMQETTFVQHTFGGCLRSKVKCLNCRHVSERYENIMDLTLEIYGWVESLEDALTQFTTPEDLDGENMYRCGRCAAYVRARKQLSIHEAPNILTIVLKRFQEGKYGKINKCITFPDLLDMVPFMTRKDDIPPLYLLYAVIVHVDTLNASFSGHYIAYVKDLRGNWFKVDDTEIQPVSLSQVMSEGAYILFYSRSSPRPLKVPSGATLLQLSKQSHKTQKHSRSGHSANNFRSPESTSYHTTDSSTKISNPIYNGVIRSASWNIHPVLETYVQPARSEFSDATSSDRTMFTSSDDASFTTESTRDSFSAPDCVDRCNNVISSIFGARQCSHRRMSVQGS
uniref:ubiquitinyl hydrolase 1 n=1 Tax=Kalanchoe fedtschenkoi TaxID=63787 RepID=A0A7N0V7I8_KALFE